MRSELSAAVGAIGAARAAIAAGGANQVTSKGGRDLVTAADIAAEDAIRRELLDRFPAIPIVGEERGGEPPDGGGTYWLVDPICGTRAFASGLQLYAINIALVERGETALVAVGDGPSGAVYVAERGGGAWRKSDDELAPIRVSDRNPILWIEPVPGNAPEAAMQVAELTRAAILADRWYIWSLGTSLALAYLAAGSIAGLLELHVSGRVHWAAPSLLASEAGATITDTRGQPWTLDSPDLVAAATPELHGDLLRLIASTLG